MFGIPLVGYELAGVILDTGDRVLVQHYLGFQAVGYYSAGYNMANYAAMSLMYPVNLAMMPIYIKLWNTKGAEETRKFLSSALDKFIMAALGVLAAVSVTARDAVVVLGSKKMQEAYPLLPLLLTGLVIYSLHIFFNAGLIIHKKTMTMAKVISFSAALNVGLNIFLIPRIGVKGAAIATLISYAVFLALIIRASSKVLPLRVDFLSCLRYLVAAGVTVLLASQIKISSNFISLVVRGLASVATYAIVLFLLDRNFRDLVKGAMESVTGVETKVTPPDVAAVSVIETKAAGVGAER